MPEWFSYSPENFLMFSARTYYRLFELHHRALWPGQLAALLAAVEILVSIGRAAARASRVVAALLATAWLSVAWSYLWFRFATIHTGGRAMAAAFALEALLLAWTGAVRATLDFAPGVPSARRLGAAIAVYGLLVAPFVAPLLGRSWTQAELFAITPDATVAATLGLLVAARRAAWYLWPIPVAWSLFSGMTLWAMRSPEWWVLPGLAFASVLLGLAWRHRALSSVAG